MKNRKASPAVKPPSALASATAATMRRFDPALTDDQLETIARAIDARTDVAKLLRAKKNRLRNGDEPITKCTVPFS